MFLPAPKPIGRRARKPGVDRKPRQAYSAKQLDQLEAEFKVCIQPDMSSRYTVKKKCYSREMLNHKTIVFP